MNISWQVIAFVAVIGVLVIANAAWRKTKGFHRNLFWVDEASSVGSAANYQVFALSDKKLGKLVGVALNDVDAMQICLDPADARRLADWLEVSAASATRSAGLPKSRTN